VAAKIPLPRVRQLMYNKVATGNDRMVWWRHDTARGEILFSNSGVVLRYISMLRGCCAPFIWRITSDSHARTETENGLSAETLHADDGK